MTYTASGQTSLMFPGIKLAGGGDPFAGERSDARRPPAYPVFADTYRLRTSAMGSDVLRRLNNAQVTGQAFRSWLPSQANVTQRREATTNGKR